MVLDLPWGEATVGSTNAKWLRLAPLKTAKDLAL